MTTKEIATLLDKCAAAMDAEDMRREHAGEMHWRAVAGEPSSIGREICERISIMEGLDDLGEIVYLLLSSSWNDALDWAERMK